MIYSIHSCFIVKRVYLVQVRQSGLPVCLPQIKKCRSEVYTGGTLQNTVMYVMNGNIDASVKLVPYQKKVN
ncbi:hypothetical protein chiPu_0003685 [Chiloscyllium punctatum]|uniref:Uncharacterized protein n=1 Tax=Chiloscyllium punctatum TaxID=137246 RepID=A0A401S4F7_CHIPU|nr:hypothetical protein [Chiloscyllium punctatum]